MKAVSLIFLISFLSLLTDITGMEILNATERKNNQNQIITSLHITSLHYTYLLLNTVLEDVMQFFIPYHNEMERKIFDPCYYCYYNLHSYSPHC